MENEVALTEKVELEPYLSQGKEEEETLLLHNAARSSASGGMAPPCEWSDMTPNGAGSHVVMPCCAIRRGSTITQDKITTSWEAMKENLSSYSLCFPDVLRLDEKQRLVPFHGYVHVKVPLLFSEASEVFVLVLTHQRRKWLRMRAMEAYRQDTVSSSSSSKYLIPTNEESDSEEEDVDMEYDPVKDLFDTVHVIQEYSLEMVKVTCKDMGDCELRLEKAMKRLRELLDLPATREMRASSDLDGAKHSTRDQIVCVAADLERVLLEIRSMTSSFSSVPNHASCIAVSPSSWNRYCEFVLHQVYTRIVAPNVQSLHKYEAFSPFVYGEIRPPFVRDMISRFGITSNSFFLDLGSGIGNIILQVAAQAQCSATGVEIMDAPAKLAALQCNEFQRRMRAFGLSHGNIRHIHADFFKHPDIPSLVSKATHIVVTNYTFPPEVNHQLLQLFLDLSPEARVISLKSFIPIGFRPTERTRDAIECCFGVQRFEYEPGWVSWTNAKGDYFVTRKLSDEERQVYIEQGVKDDTVAYRGKRVNYREKKFSKKKRVGK